jgi:methylated-DNA-protein-cysteine methyltransferase-like protein
MTLYEEIWATVRKIPWGYVSSYSQVARAIGKPRGAQMVGWALRQAPLESVPWQRVINQKRQISIVNPKVTKIVQKELLESEGREIIEKDGYYTVIGDDWFSFD